MQTLGQYAPRGTTWNQFTDRRMGTGDPNPGGPGSNNVYAALMNAVSGGGGGENRGGRAMLGQGYGAAPTMTNYLAPATTSAVAPSSTPAYGSNDPVLQHYRDIARMNERARAERYDEPTFPGGRLANKSMRVAYKQLLEILQQHGATDPRLFNTQITDLSRGNESNQQQYEQGLAAQGLSGSGVGQAGAGALMASGSELRAKAFAAESALQEQRKRSDMQMIIDMILNPRLAYRAQNLGLSAQQDANAAARQASQAQALAAILGVFGSAVGGPRGATPPPAPASPPAPA